MSAFRASRCLRFGSRLWFATSLSEVKSRRGRRNNLAAVQNELMSGREVIRPFRWDVSRRNELGTLPRVELPETYPRFENDLLDCLTRVVAFAGDSDLVLIGRSPQPLFDLSSGLLFDTSWSDRLHLLNVSLRHQGEPTEEELRAVRPYFAAVGLEPLGLVRRRRTIALVDVVDTGDTLGRLLTLLKEWGDHDRVDWSQVARRIRIVGLTWREKTSPNTRRWQQHAPWVAQLRPRTIKNVSVPGALFGYLAADAPKTSHAFTPASWGDDEAARPVHDDEARQALALAVHLFDLGCGVETRRRFARGLSGQPTMTERWYRSLVTELNR